MVTAWPRIGELRLAPVNFNMGPVDNRDAAKAFVDELEQRQEIKSDTRKFLGPLDFWFGWLALLVVLGFLIRKPKISTDLTRSRKEENRYETKKIFTPKMDYINVNGKLFGIGESANASFWVSIKVISNVSNYKFDFRRIIAQHPGEVQQPGCVVMIRPRLKMVPFNS